MKGAAAGKGDLRKMMRSALAQKKQEKKITSPLVRYRAPIHTLFNLYFYILFLLPLKGGWIKCLCFFFVNQ